MDLECPIKTLGPRLGAQGELWEVLKVFKVFGEVLGHSSREDLRLMVNGRS